jgi:Mce-associated membrane protein
VKRIVLPLALFVLAAALVVTGTLLLIHPRSKGAPANDAIIDRSRTTQVVGQVSTALNEVLSYSYSDPKQNADAAKKWLAGDAVNQYHVLFTQLQKRAPDQKLTFIAKVVTAGVTTLSDDSAQLLVFLDQKSTRASDGQSSVAAAQVQIAAKLQGGTWRITELKPL